MKKNRFFWASAAIAALTLTACADQDEFNQNDVQTAAIENSPGAIQFGTYLGKEGSTRAIIPQTYSKGTIGNKTDAVIGITDLKAAHFGVFGYFTKTMPYREEVGTWGTADTHWKATTSDVQYPNFFYNQEIMFDDATGKNAWVYEPVKYWPNGVDAANSDTNPNVSNTPSNTATEGDGYQNQKLSFFAYAPFVTTPTDDYADVAASDVKPDQITDASWIKQFGDGVKNGIKAMTTNESKTDVWVKYLMPYATTTQAVDLLWGLAGKEAYKETDGWNPAKTIGDDYNENLTKQIVGERVKFLFKHALAKLGGATADGDESIEGNPKKCGLMVVADVDYNSTTPNIDGQSKQGADYFPTDFNRKKTLITLKSVKIQDGLTAKGDNTTGVYGKSITSTLLTRGWFNIETGKWCEDANTFGVGATGGATYNVTATSANADVNDETYTINDDIREPSDAAAVTSLLKVSPDTDPSTWDGDGTADKPLGVNIGTPQPVFADENVPALLFIPTGKGTDETNQKIYVTVDYLVRTADPNLRQGYSEVEQVITNEVILNGQKLDPNKYYTLVMHLGMTSVKFEAVVTDWSSNTGDDFNEDGTITEQGQEETEVVWLPSNVIANNIVATISGGNYFSNQNAYSKDLTVTYNDGETATTIDKSKISVSGVSWLTYNSGTGKLSTNDANTATNAPDREGVLTVTVEADGDRPELKQDIIVTQYGNPALDVIVGDGKGKDGKLKVDGDEVSLTTKLRGKTLTPASVSVDLGSATWITHSSGTLTAETNVGSNDERTATVTVTYTDGDLGNYTGSTTVTQVAANLVVTLTSTTLTNAANVTSDLTATFNGTPLTSDQLDEIAVTITYTDGEGWLKYNAAAHTIETTSANSSGSPRKANVIVSYNGYTAAAVEITQNN